MEHKPKHEAVLLETLELPAGVVMEGGRRGARPSRRDVDSRRV